MRALTGFSGALQASRLAGDSRVAPLEASRPGAGRRAPRLVGAARRVPTSGSPSYRSPAAALGGFPRVAARAPASRAVGRDSISSSANPHSSRSPPDPPPLPRGPPAPLPEGRSHSPPSGAPHPRSRTPPPGVRLQSASTSPSGSRLSSSPAPPSEPHLPRSHAAPSGSHPPSSPTPPPGSVPSPPASSAPRGSLDAWLDDSPTSRLADLAFALVRAHAEEPVRVQATPDWNLEVGTPSPSLHRADVLYADLFRALPPELQRAVEDRLRALWASEPEASQRSSMFRAVLHLLPPAVRMQIECRLVKDALAEHFLVELRKHYEREAERTGPLQLVFVGDAFDVRPFVADWPEGTTAFLVASSAAHREAQRALDWSEGAAMPAGCRMVRVSVDMRREAGQDGEGEAESRGSNGWHPHPPSAAFPTSLSSSFAPHLASIPFRRRASSGPPCFFAEHDFQRRAAADQAGRAGESGAAPPPSSSLEASSPSPLDALVDAGYRPDRTSAWIFSAPARGRDGWRGELDWKRWETVGCDWTRVLEGSGGCGRGEQEVRTLDDASRSSSAEADAAPGRPLPPAPPTDERWARPAVPFPIAWVHEIAAAIHDARSRMCDSHVVLADLGYSPLLWADPESEAARGEFARGEAAKGEAREACISSVQETSSKGGPRGAATPRERVVRLFESLGFFGLRAFYDADTRGWDKPRGCCFCHAPMDDEGEDAHAQSEHWTCFAYFGRTPDTQEDPEAARHYLDMGV